jgi:ankyrin repeat protein
MLIPLIAVSLIAAFIVWGVVYTKTTGKPFIVYNSGKPDEKPKQSPYHQLLATPASQLTDDQKRDQLSGALSWKNESRIDELLSTGKDFLSKVAKHNSETWLAQAVTNNCGLSIIEKLFHAGCDPNGYVKSPKESRPLEIAVSNDRIDVVEWLLARKADPNIGRPIVAAINHEKSADTQLALLTLLLNAGADVNRTFPLFGDESKRFTVLDWAMLYKISPKVIEFLKLRGAKNQWTEETIRASQQELQMRRIV